VTTSAERLSRLLALVPWLRVNDGITMEEAAAHFGVSVTQLEDDLNLLICCGLPGYTHAELIDIQFWDDGIIHVLDPQTIGDPMRLSAEEATALLIALRLLAQIPGGHDRVALISATVRLQEAVGGVDAGVVVDAGVDESVARAIATAIADGGDLQLAYGAASDHITERVVHPLRTIAHGGRTYLEAYCRSAEAVRTFRVDRVLSAQPLPSSGPIPQGATLVEAAPDSVATATIAVRAPWAAEALGMRDAQPAPDGRLTGRIPVHDRAWVVHAVLGLGGAAEVLEPTDLRREVAQAATLALSSYA
jgi:proteasome accessory factor C